MKKSDILQNVSETLGIKRRICEIVLDSVIEEITQALKRDEKVHIKEFLTIEVGRRRERNARNPQTGELDHYPEVKTIKCKICQKIKDEINGKGVT